MIKVKLEPLYKRKIRLVMVIILQNLCISVERDSFYRNKKLKVIKGTNFSKSWY
jgi:hypothetical protein